jgi:hypothetical protein
MKTSIDKAAGGGWVVTVSKVLPCKHEASGVRTHLLERCFNTKAEAEEFERAVQAVGVVDGGFGGLFLTSDVHKCEHKGCSAWLGNNYFSDDRCNSNRGAGLVLCEKHADKLAKLDDAAYTKLVEDGTLLAGGRGYFKA